MKLLIFFASTGCLFFIAATGWAINAGSYGIAAVCALCAVKLMGLEVVALLRETK